MLLKVYRGALSRFCKRRDSWSIFSPIFTKDVISSSLPWFGFFYATDFGVWLHRLNMPTMCYHIIWGEEIMTTFVTIPFRFLFDPLSWIGRASFSSLESFVTLEHFFRDVDAFSSAFIREQSDWQQMLSAHFYAGWGWQHRKAIRRKHWACVCRVPGLGTERIGYEASANWQSSFQLIKLRVQLIKKRCLIKVL